MMLSSSSRAVVRRSTELGRACNLSLRRFKATLKVEREELTAANVPSEERVASATSAPPSTEIRKGFGTRSYKNKNQSNFQPQRLRLDGMTNRLIAIVPGEMDAEEWGEAKYLVNENCKKERPEYASRLLDRMIAECYLRPKTYSLYRSLFNITISAWAKRKKPDEAEKVFAQMLHLHNELPTICPSPDRYSYNALLKAWAGSNSPIAIDRVVELLNEMEESEIVQPDAYTYNIVMGAYADRVGEYGAAKAAEDVLLRFSERHMKGLVSPGPETMSFNIVMKAWNNSGDEKGPDRAMEIFTLMEKLHSEGHDHVNPDTISLMALMNAYSSKGDLETMESLLFNSNVDGDMNRCYNCAITGYAKSGKADAGDNAERLLGMMDNADDITHSIVLQAHAKADRPDAASRAEDFLGRTVEAYLKYQSDIRPIRKMFHVVLRAWKEHADVKEAAERSLALVRDMQGLANEWTLQTRPDISTYSFPIELWAQIDVKKADELLKEVESRKEVPFVRSYNVVLEKLTERKNRPAIEHSMKVLERMKKNGAENTYGYNFVLYGMTKLRSNDYKLKSLAYLATMEEKFRGGDKSVRPNMLTYTNILNSLSIEPSEQDARAAVDVFDRMIRLHNDPTSRGKSDMIGHTIILMILARAKLPFAAEKATEIFDMMLADDYHVFPDAGCMSSVILANARAPNSKYTHIAHDRMVNLFRLYLDGKIEQHPYPATVTSVLHAWSKCRDPCAIDKAAEIFDLVHKMDAAGAEEFVPNKRIICSYFTVLSNGELNNGGEEAETILESLEQTDSAMWNTVLNIWARSNRSDKAAQTKRCLEKMKESESAPMPNQYQYNSVLNAAAFSNVHGPEVRKEALDVATSAFKELKADTSAQPDHVTYGSIMKCYRQLMEPSQERADIIQEIFKECKENGYVGILPLRELQMCLRQNDFREALGEGVASSDSKAIDISLLPKEMTRNVPVNDMNRNPKKWF